MTIEQKDSFVKPETLSHDEIVWGSVIFDEGRFYEACRHSMTKVGTHLSFVFHKGRGLVSIHFREGLKELRDHCDEPVKMIKMFLTNLRDDLGELASMIESDPALHKVKEIWGICSLPARWGERYGFITKTWSDDPELVEQFEQSIAGRPNVDSLALAQPLSLFIYNRASFMIKFLRKQN